MWFKLLFVLEFWNKQLNFTWNYNIPNNTVGQLISFFVSQQCLILLCVNDLIHWNLFGAVIYTESLENYLHGKITPNFQLYRTITIYGFCTNQKNYCLSYKETKKRKRRRRKM